MKLIRRDADLRQLRLPHRLGDELDSYLPYHTVFADLEHRLNEREAADAYERVYRQRRLNEMNV